MTPTGWPSDLDQFVASCWVARLMLAEVWSSSSVPDRLYTLDSTVRPDWVALLRLSSVTVPLSSAYRACSVRFASCAPRKLPAWSPSKLYRFQSRLGQPLFI